MNLKESLLQHNAIILNAEVRNWKEAIKLGTDLLEQAGVVDERYFQAIVKVTEDLGAYYILAPGLAMPHASPDDGPLQNGFALVTLKKPVIFDEDNAPVDVLITLAATDRKTHNAAGIMQVANLFGNPDNLRTIRNARSVQEIIQLMDDCK